MRHRKIENSLSTTQKGLFFILSNGFINNVDAYCFNLLISLSAKCKFGGSSGLFEGIQGCSQNFIGRHRAAAELIV